MAAKQTVLYETSEGKWVKKEIGKTDNFAGAVQAMIIGHQCPRIMFLDNDGNVVYRFGTGYSSVKKSAAARTWNKTYDAIRSKG